VISKINKITIGSDEISLNTNYNLKEKEKLTIDSKHISKDGFGTVYRGEYNHAEVAVKVIEIDDGMDEKIAKQSLIALMKVTNHPNLVNFYGYKSDSKTLTIVLELCKGGSLRSLLSSTVYLTLKQKLKILLDSSAALFHLHSKGGLHRDIKSENFLLVEPSTEYSNIIVKMTGYDLLTVIDMNDAQSTICGTPQWTAPEVFLTDDDENPTTYGLKADIYSFGVFMWEVYARKIPYSGMKLSPPQIGPMVTYKGLRPDLKLLAVDTPADVKDLIVKCFDKDPNVRPDIAQIYETIKRLYIESDSK
jgi:serine/threonine protein kinase